jgi:hypothetical protein
MVSGHKLVKKTTGIGLIATVVAEGCVCVSIATIVSDIRVVRSGGELLKCTLGLGIIQF